MANVSSPDYSEHIKDLRFSLLPLEPDTLFCFLIDLVSICRAPLGSHGRKETGCGNSWEPSCKSVLLDSLSLQMDCPLFIDQLEAPCIEAIQHSYWLSHWPAIFLHRVCLWQWAIVNKDDDNNSDCIEANCFILYCSSLPALTTCIVSLRARAFIILFYIISFY